jgi:hypothetical protein
VTPVCPYCEQPAGLVDGTRVYPHRPDLGHKRFWLCGPCDAYVGCHAEGAWAWVDGRRTTSDGTWPLGRLADAELRRAKSAAHRAVDPLWSGQCCCDGHVAAGGRCPRCGTVAVPSLTRSQAYAALAKAMRMNKDQCHIGLFDLEQCRAAVEAAHELRKRIQQLRRR